MAFFTLPGQWADFAVCHKCQAGILDPLGLGRFLVQTSNQDVHCDTCSNPPRVEAYVTMALDAAARGVYAHFDNVRSLAALPLCPARRSGEPQVVRLQESRLVCPECWATFAPKTPLAAGFAACNAQASLYARCTHPACALWTKCSELDDTAELLQFRGHREEVYILPSLG
jgi:hypothetical protein